VNSLSCFKWCLLKTKIGREDCKNKKNQRIDQEDEEPVVEYSTPAIKRVRVRATAPPTILGPQCKQTNSSSFKQSKIEVNRRNLSGFLLRIDELIDERVRTVGCLLLGRRIS